MTDRATKFEALNPDELDYRLTATMTLKEWRIVWKALDEGKDGWYGPALWLMTSIKDMINQAETVFRPKAGA